MNTVRRIETYIAQNGGAQLTHRQRRRVVKRAGSVPSLLVTRDNGPSYPAAQQGLRCVALPDFVLDKWYAASSSEGVRGQRVVNVILNEEAELL